MQKLARSMAAASFSLLASTWSGAEAAGETPPPHPEAAKEAPHQKTHGAPATLAGWAQGAILFDGLGGFHRKVSTSSEEAQRWFDQGIGFLWAFNHDESTRSFARAAEIDPECASCWWGVALTVGPNYNLPMMAESRAKVAWEALELARRHAAEATAVEQALIAALGKRYDGPRPLDPSNSTPVFRAYAEAMREVARRFPDDLDVQTLWAESMMNLNPWKLWTADGKPAPGTEEIVATLESVLRRDPGHPGANHYYVHAVEASPKPERAIGAAERLRGMMPDAGHLEHMPAHIFQRVGRYEEASAANRRGAEADLAYLQKTRPPDYYAVYTAHNYQFLAYSAAMEGRRAETVAAARKSREAVSDAVLEMMPGMDWYVSELYSALVRFGLWDEMLAEPAPNPKLPTLRGGWLWARAFALTAKGRVAEAKAALAELEKFAEDVPADAGAGMNLAKDVSALAARIVEARIASAEKKTGAAISLYRDAVAREDALAYDEPADWFFPVRHLLGAELLRAGRAEEAERIYREDLERNPGNGWSLRGLARALEAQGKREEAARVEKEFRRAWKNADVEIASSAF